jgi:hypothetical protein
MKTYPSISYAAKSHLPIYAFDKLDGSNIRAEWTSKKGWHKFGTRHHLIDAHDPIFGQAPKLITDKYGESLAKALKDAGFESATCFFELWGPSSFAGMHSPKEKLTITLFDIAPFNQGILMPDRFLKVAGHLDHARLLYQGPCTEAFIQSVRDSSLPGMTFEGVVCKSINNKKTKMPVMFKQKSRAWLNKLREYCGNDKKLLNALM